MTLHERANNGIKRQERKVRKKKRVRGATQSNHLYPQTACHDEMVAVGCRSAKKERGQCGIRTHANSTKR